MVAITKPINLSLTWASSGDILDPGDIKYATGWQVEIPPRQWFNYLDNRQDEAIAHINQHGIAVWDASTEYQYGAGTVKSLVMGSNGTIYRTLTTNTNQNPTTTVGVHWEIAFANAGDFYTKAEVDSKTTISSTAQSQAWSSNSTLLTPLRLAEAFQAANQSLSGNGYQKMPGGLILQWGATSPSAVGDVVTSTPIPFPNQFLQVLITQGYTPGTGVISYAGVHIINNSQFTWRGSSPTGQAFRFIAIGY